MTSHYINDIDLSRFNKFLQGGDATTARTYYELDNLPSIEELFPEHVYYAILFKKNPGTAIGHWVCLIKHSETHFEYFDCLAGAIPVEISNVLQEYKQHSSELQLDSVKKPLMSQDNYICGKWTMFRIMSLPHNLESFVKFFDTLIGKRKITKDSIVNFIINIPYGYSA